MVATTGATTIIPSASLAATPVMLFAEQRAALIKSFDPRALAWLALLPTWTERLALACHFPVGSENLEELLVRMEIAGLCRPQRSSRTAGRPTGRAAATGAHGPGKIFLDASGRQDRARRPAAARSGGRFFARRGLEGR